MWLKLFLKGQGPCRKVSKVMGKSKWSGDFGIQHIRRDVAFDSEYDGVSFR